MHKLMTISCFLCAAACIFAAPVTCEEAGDELTAIDRELDAAEAAAPAEVRRAPVSVIQATPPGNEQGSAEGHDSSWVKRDMSELCGKIDMLKTDTKKGKPFRFDRDDLDTSRTGKPDRIPRDTYNDNH